MVTSLAFIAYFFAGGYFEKYEVSLPAVNAHFSKPVVLAVMAWIIFFWFIYRYWVTHKKSFRDAYGKEIRAWVTSPSLTDFVNKRLNEHMGNKAEVDGRSIKGLGYHPAKLYREKWYMMVGCHYANESKFKINGDYEGGTGSRLPEGLPHSRKLHITGLRGWLFVIKSNISCIFENPSFSSYAIPYLLAALAIFGGIRHLWCSCG